jgi:glycosyltransferase involved in cell wall biosynthesis
MKINFYSPINNVNNGYGYANYHIKQSLMRLNYELHNESPIRVCFSQPYLYKFDIYNNIRIGYTPWESTALPDGWLKAFNSLDELWTTSALCKRWYLEAGVSVPIYVFHHGVDEMWTPRQRNSFNRVKFLHIGEPSPRKGGQLALEAFIAAFGKNDYVSLTIKAQKTNTTRVYQSGHRGGSRSILGLPHQIYGNVRMITDDLPAEEMVSLLHSHDVLVYPSWGEGFGLIPLQALATGMPVICTEAWAPYASHLGGLGLNSRLADSKWPHIHPGKMFEPDFDHLVELYRQSYEHNGELSKRFYENAPAVWKEYDWEMLTKTAFGRLENL